MASGVVENVFRTGYKISIEWSSVPNLAENKSTVTANFYLTSLGPSYTISSSAPKSLTVYIDGEGFGYTVYVGLSGNQKKLLSTSVKEIYHNPDGSRSFALSGDLGINVTLGSTYYSTVSVGPQYFALETFERASTITATDAYVDGSSYIDIIRASSAFTHTLVYSFPAGELNGTIANGATEDYTWNIPPEFLPSFYNKASWPCTIYCYTYNGSTPVGSPTSATININVNQTQTINGRWSINRIETK